MGMLKEFREFAVKGNAVDMAVGLIIGAAFGKIVTSLVNDVIMPPIGMLLGKVPISPTSSSRSRIKTWRGKAAAVPTINYGLFLNTILDFVIVAFCMFLVVKQMNRIKQCCCRRRRRADHEDLSAMPFDDPDQGKTLCPLHVGARWVARRGLLTARDMCHRFAEAVRGVTDWTGTACAKQWHTAVKVANYSAPSQRPKQSAN